MHLRERVTLDSRKWIGVGQLGEAVGSVAEPEPRGNELRLRRRPGHQPCTSRTRCR